MKQRTRSMNRKKGRECLSLFEFSCVGTCKRDKPLLKGLASSKATRLNQTYCEKDRLKTTEVPLKEAVVHEIKLWEYAGWSREVVAKLLGRIRVAPRVSTVFRQACKNVSNH